MTRSTTYSGRCSCGKVRFSVSEPFRNLCFCHCESCRRATGGALVAWGTVDAGNFRVLSGELAVLRSSAHVERGFCGACGTALTFRSERRAGDVDFTLASLDDPTVVAPRIHIWVQDKLPWVQIEDGRPQYQTVPGHAGG